MQTGYEDNSQAFPIKGLELKNSFSLVYLSNLYKRVHLNLDKFYIDDDFEINMFYLFSVTTTIRISIMSYIV